jgi:hypothetical protein
MGSLYKGVCFPDLPTAKAEQCAQSNAVWGATTSMYTVECNSTVFTGTTFNSCRRLNGGTCTNITVPFNTYPSCTYDGDVTKSLDFFGALLGFLVVVFVASRIYKMFWGSHESM